MSRVHNEPKYKNGLLQAIRAQLEHRAFWLYLLCDEASKRGLDPRDFGSATVKRCGLSQGTDLVKKGGTDSLKGLKKTLFTKPAQLVFEMEILKYDLEYLFFELIVLNNLFLPRNFELCLTKVCPQKNHKRLYMHHPFFGKAHLLILEYRENGVALIYYKI